MCWWKIHRPPEGIAERRRARWKRTRRSLWISPGARLAFLATTLGITLIVAFVAVPFYSDRNQRREEAKQAALVRAAQQRRTAAFLHNFDCTFGVALKSTLHEARRTYYRQAQVARAARIVALHAGDRGRARVNGLSRRDALRTARRYGQLERGIQPLGPHIPCSR